jgi:HEAT repeat protein
VPRLGLALRRTAAGRATLGRLARQDPDPHVRAFAVHELGLAADAARRADLVAALDDPTPTVRDNARWALARLP